MDPRTTPQGETRRTESSGLLPARDHRRSRRRALPGTFVAIEAPDISGNYCWGARAIDINGDGMRLVLPPELPRGATLLLSMCLDSATEFDRVPAVVVRQDSEGGNGAVEFRMWPDAARLKLLNFLLER